MKRKKLKLEVAFLSRNNTHRCLSCLICVLILQSFLSCRLFYRLDFDKKYGVYCPIGNYPANDYTIYYTLYKRAYLADTLDIEDPVVLRFMGNMFVTSRNVFDNHTVDYAFFFRPDVYLYNSEPNYTIRFLLYPKRYDDKCCPLGKWKYVVDKKNAEGGFSRTLHEADEYWFSRKKKLRRKQLTDVAISEFEETPKAFYLVLMTVDNYEGTRANCDGPWNPDFYEFFNFLHPYLMYCRVLYPIAKESDGTTLPQQETKQ